MADIGTGCTIVFTTSGFSGEILDVKGGFQRKSIDITNLAAAPGDYHTKMPGDLVDAKPIVLEILFDPDKIPPILGAIETVTITFPLPAGKITAAKLVGKAFVMEWDFNIPLEEKMTGTMQIEWQGGSANKPVFTASA